MDPNASNLPGTDRDKADWTEVLQGAPPWLGSLVIHMMLLIFLGLMVATFREKKPDEAIQATVYGEQIGEQLLEDNSQGLVADTLDPTVEKSVFSPTDLPPVADPFAAPPALANLPLSAGGRFAASPRAIDAPIGLALTGRERGKKIALLRGYGGNETTQASVQRALEWLKRNQRASGFWTLNGPFPDGGETENRVAATAMALLAFQGDGYTPLANADSEHDYRPTLKKAWDALLKLQTTDGQFVEPSAPQYHMLYTHAQATIALCELYGMTQDSTYRSAAQKAVQFCVKSQDPAGGGWRYFPGSDSDTSV